MDTSKVEPRQIEEKEEREAIKWFPLLSYTREELLAMWEKADQRVFAAKDSVEQAEIHLKLVLREQEEVRRDVRLALQEKERVYQAILNGEPVTWEEMKEKQREELEKHIVETWGRS